MPFEKNRFKSSLRNGRKNPTSFQRVFLSAFKGSLTLEAAVVLPLFLFALTSLLYLNEVIRCSDTVASALHQSARRFAAYNYVTGADVSPAYAASRVNSALDEAGIKRPSISYLRSGILDRDVIDIVAVEEIDLPFDIFGIGKVRIMDRARMHAFTGYDPAKDGRQNTDTDEEIVYITPGGSVYHKSRGCPHLKVSPRAVDAASVTGCRNSSGGKYYECEFCRSGSRSGTFYITDYGDRYHTSLTCQGLKRDVMSVPISKAGGRPACKTCGGG